METQITTKEYREELYTEEYRSERARLARVPVEKRILLIPHCLRISGKCRAESTSDGLICKSCDPGCQVKILSDRAKELGYRGICVAPGGSLALRYVKKTMPEGIVAVACPRELSEGVENVRELNGENENSKPPILIIPLVKEGCVDTEVNLESALDEISIGC